VSAASTLSTVTAGGRVGVGSVVALRRRRVIRRVLRRLRISGADDVVAVRGLGVEAAVGGRGRAAREDAARRRTNRNSRERRRSERRDCDNYDQAKQPLDLGIQRFVPFELFCRYLSAASPEVPSTPNAVGAGGRATQAARKDREPPSAAQAPMLTSAAQGWRGPQACMDRSPRRQGRCPFRALTLPLLRRRSKFRAE